MPHFVTHILATRRARPATPASGAPGDDEARVTHAYRRRLAALRATAPDTLRARVRRELSAAAAPAARSG